MFARATHGGVVCRAHLLCNVLYCVALIFALVISVPAAWAQSPYGGVGGYLERPGQDDGSGSSAGGDDGDSDSSSTQRRTRRGSSTHTENPLAMPGLDQGPQTIPPHIPKRNRAEREPEPQQRRSSHRNEPSQRQTDEKADAQGTETSATATDANAGNAAANNTSGNAGNTVSTPQPASQTPPPAQAASAGSPPSAAALTPGQPATGDPLDKIIGQMLMVGFTGLSPEDPWVQKLVGQIKSGKVGGVLFLSQNIASPQQLAPLTAELRRASDDLPVLLAVDQEGGIVQRLAREKGFAEYPTAGQVGKSNDPLTAYATYQNLAQELAKYGFNLNLGPVVDLQRDDASPIIAGKERAFGSAPKHVAAFAKAFCAAHRDAGVATVLKHFPGHGSAALDTHAEAVDITKSWSPDELEPYRQLIKAGFADIVMVGHISHSIMADEPGLPASLSEKAITKYLRGDLGFTGVVLSDDLEMAAIAKRFSLEDRVIRAIKAGNDIIILGNQNQPSPDLPERVIAIIKDAVAKGIISRERLQASYDRITALKRKMKATAPAIVSVKQDSGEKGANPKR